MLPEQFLSRMKQMLGDDYPAFLESYDKERYQALRVNPLKKNKSGVDTYECLAALFCLTRVPWAENGFYYEKEDAPGKHPYHEAGLYYIQEPSAMAPVEKLDVKPGQRVLDLCAAPGGKSTQIAGKLQGKGLLLCNEIHAARAKILSENIERMGVSNALVTNETPAHLAELFPGYFDRILVDAPCSGEGMFRKNEDAISEWSPENVELCAKRQAEILDCASKMLRPGGRIVYSTCTFAPQENEGSIQCFLERNSEFQLLKEKRIYPHQVNGEGHFYAVLVKDGREEGNLPSMAQTGLESAVSVKDCKDLKQFETDTLKFPITEIFPYTKLIRFGENLYLAPDCLPGLKGIKVLRPGLHLGQEKKNRFEPSHALALALGESEVRQSCNLEVSDPKVKAYLQGQTFSCAGENGWHLICVEGFSMGWGKLAQGTMKNHYPKGLRWN